jgi:hypothetical protein
LVTVYPTVTSLALYVASGDSNVFVMLPVNPASSVTVSVTLNVPFVSYAWVVFTPAAVRDEANAAARTALL